MVTAKLKNGFVLTADSACVDPANYDKRMGERICLEHIANKLWELEGYRLQWDVFNKENRKGTAPGLDDETLDEMRTRLKGAREIVELANECGRQVCDEARHFACPFGDESMENCALRLEAKYDETIGLLLDLAEMMG